MPPLFSVVIPTYNQADYLRQALKSVLDQAFGDFEVIIVNNYSTDHTLDVIQEARDDRVQVINFRNHGVIGASRNVGIKASQGAYVAFLDSDDTWHENKLERVAQAIQANPQAGVICHNQVIYRDGRFVRQSNYGPPRTYGGDLHNYLLLVGNCVSTSATTVARRCLNQVGYFSEDSRLVTVEDYDLWLTLSQVCRFQFMPEILGTQRFYLGSASANAEVHLRSTLCVLDKHTGGLKIARQPLLKRTLRRRYAYAFLGAARQYHRQWIVKQAFGYYSRALRVYPFLLKAHAGLALLAVDLIVGQRRRRKITDSFAPGI